MSDDIKIRMLPNSFTCPQCECKLEWESHVCGDERKPLEKGDIIVCSNCLRTLQLGDSKLRVMSKGEIAKLHPNARMTLKLTLMSLMKQSKTDRGRN